ncbi:MAG TPA: MYXO-CTERM sorting domain-containing protein [Kofleriaceae bacterium]|nr:MYXO-CTERM sorting domain-containing protein [Kofleriaceae bacterium]
MVAAHSYWTEDRSRIVTEATVHTPDGRDLTVSQLGGSVDGIGMIQMPGPELLVPGMHVAVAAHGDVDLALREHIVLDSVKVMAYPAGFVRTGPTLGGNPLHWESSCVYVTIDAAGTSALPGAAEFPVIEAALATWNDATSSCSSMSVTSRGREALEVGNDGINLIKIRDTTWGRPAVGNDPARTYSPSAAGLTVATYVDVCKDKDTGGCKASCLDASGRCTTTSAHDGAILDADIEINNVNFAVAVNGLSNTPGGFCIAELQNTLTHELGHLHGLEHTCLAPGDPPRVDHLGNPVPDCTTVQSNPTLPANMRILEATMYNYQDCGETSKEVLSDDDIQSMCVVYPKSKPLACEAPDASSGGGCCSASGDRTPEAALLLSGAVALVLARRRRRR